MSIVRQHPGTSGSDALAAGQAAGAVGSSPDGDGLTTPLDWNKFLITHRGSLTGGLADDLYAYDPAHGLMYRYANSDAAAGAFPATLPYANTSNALPVKNPATNTSAWPTDITQILAVGNPDGSSTSPTGLLAIENGTLYYYPGVPGNAPLAARIQLGTSAWGNMTLIAPGYEGPNAQLVLWARDNTSGSLYAYKFTMVSVSGTATPTLSAAGTVTPVAPEGGDATLITGVPALTKAAYPTIASAGDGIGSAAIYVVDTSGVIRALAANPHPASDASPLQGTLTQAGTIPSGVTVSQVS